jgi:thiol-disulfide isomerase/thioredoxin
LASESFIEDQAVRTSIGVALVVVCLGLAGCSLFGKKQTGTGGSRPFLGSGPASGGPAPAAAETASTDPSSPPPGANGLLAGQVLDRFNRHPSKVFIQVVDLQESNGPPAARLEVESQQDGYFVVQGLKPGHHYRLIARLKDGDKVLAGSTLAKPPNPRLSIYLSEELASADTPAVPDPPSVPGIKPSGGADNAALDPPVKTRPGETPPPKNDVSPPSNPTGSIWAPNPIPPAAPNRTGGPVFAPERVAEGNNTGGWGRVPPAPPADIPGTPPSPSLPPTPQWNTPPSSPPSSPPVSPGETPAFPGVHLPSVSTPVPSCVVVGRRLENFALNDLNFEAWEFRRHHRGRVVLLDFWFSTCGPCREAITHLVNLQRTYGPYGLEIIGIAYEQGAPADQVSKVRAVRARYGINYITLLGAGMSCPVKTQLRVEKFPTLVLLDENGQIVWHSGNDGIGDEYAKRELETEIRRRLGIR